MNAPRLPLGAETPDELLVAHVNGSLAPDERAAVDAWLAANPGYDGRVDSLRAVRAAVRTAPPGVDARPPSAADLTGLWAAIDAAPAAPPLPPPVAPVAPLGDARRRRRPRWALAAAAAAVLVVGGVVAVVAVTGSDDETDTATPAPGTASPTAPAEPSDAGTGDVEPGAAESADELRAALTRSAEATTEARTANVTFRAVADAELSVGPVRLEMAGSGQVELPGRSILNTRTTLSAAADGEVLLPPEEASVVEDGDRTFVRCGGEPDYTEQSTEAADCATLDLGPELFGPDATIDMLAEAESLDIVEVGEDTLDGDHITGYQVVQPVALDGASVPLVMQIWIDDDALMRRIVGAAEYSAAEDPTLRSLVITYELSDFGVPVDIPELD